ncbi:MAG TPA: class I tRNA ligase family protein, partial [Gemmatimonadales bacterium]|nr:class I tRNA ligase family protein [Gemmatimonadales bacterium]
AAATVYHFLWSDLADWYLEQVKPRLYGNQPGGDAAKAVAAHVLELALRLLHPVMPFITETLWRRLPHAPADRSIAQQAWPVAAEARDDAEALASFGAVQAVIGAVRALRAEYQVAPGQTVNVTLADASPLVQAAVAAEGETIRRLAKVATLELGPAPSAACGTVVLEDRTAVIVPLGDLVDIEKECARLGAEATKLEQLVAAQVAKLGNESFVARAPAAVVEKEREKLETWRAQAEALRAQRRTLGCAD